MLAANAAAIKQHTAEIGDIYNNPVIAIDKIAQAQRDLLEAMATVDKYKDEGIQAARQNIATLRAHVGRDAGQARRAASAVRGGRCDCRSLTRQRYATVRLRAKIVPKG